MPPTSPRLVPPAPGQGRPHPPVSVPRQTRQACLGHTDRGATVRGTRTATWTTTRPPGDDFAAPRGRPVRRGFHRQGLSGGCSGCRAVRYDSSPRWRMILRRAMHRTGGAWLIHEAPPDQDPCPPRGCHARRTRPPDDAASPLRATSRNENRCPRCATPHGDTPPRRLLLPRCRQRGTAPEGEPPAGRPPRSRMSRRDRSPSAGLRAAAAGRRAPRLPRVPDNHGP